MTADFLSEIVARKCESVNELRAATNESDFVKRALQARDNRSSCRLRSVLEADDPAIKVIAEFKRKSPSCGILRADFPADEAATCYERGGACAVSVLTDKEYFDGSIDDLISIRERTELPILRKDFMIDPIQIYEAAAAGADAILLIAAVLNDFQLMQMRVIAEEELGLDALIEVHTSEELHRAQQARAKLIGINNRDLRTLEVSLKTSERLIDEAPRDVVMISESGLHAPEQLWHLRELGFRGFLIGETLMQSEDPAAALRQLVGGYDE